ncbi:hypothetical protein U370_02015 [Anaplasma marginale str. Dawn]|uniref:Uncharacterized protein n=2 Tax=Anaplasma marginale TaxID=770 RepID=A0A643CMT9_ANAMA|nr:hypothetical protein [Anaplasma marginale]AGZ78803.1 hypothetical protein U128_02060 [Anaplasma marginale str. Gypsy Plains]AGZ79635.1 hypothetical protein U370_02015 [Anaplasma marginale str. Dawn]AXW84003.1 hypothetical protein CQZ76_02055 [Anaplasma marginale]AXW84922.1 hypothetical protein BKM88_02045 [Anaplasma marginale]KAA8473179.1 hypothetical protein F0Q58_00830 [Anaplasma marginale]
MSEGKVLWLVGRAFSAFKTSYEFSKSAIRSCGVKHGVCGLAPLMSFLIFYLLICCYAIDVELGFLCQSALF